MDTVGFQPRRSDEDFKRRCIGWQRKISYWPRKCHYTGKSIWFKKAYQGTEMITGPGTPIFEHRWVHPDDYLFLKIKGTI
jgi:hypothetical protein